MKIEVGDVVYKPSIGVGYVVEEGYKTHDLIVYFPSIMKSIGMKPYDKSVTRIIKHSTFLIGDKVHCGCFGYGTITDREDGKKITVAFNSIGRVEYYNLDGTIRGLQAGTNANQYRLFRVSDGFVSFKPDNPDKKKDDIIKDVIRKLTALLTD